MQKATSAITFPYIVSHLYLQFLHSMQKLNHKSSFQSITPRSKIHGTLQINQSNFLISNNTFIQGLKRIITFMLVYRQERFIS